MASSSTLATVLGALKAHAVAVAVASTVLVGGGTAVAVVATGTVQLPGQQPTTGRTAHPTEAAGAHATSGSAARQAACTQNNGDALRLASVYGPLFAGDVDSAGKPVSAQDEICTLFVGSDGHAVGFGEVQQILDIVAAIQAQGGSSACLTTPLAASTPGKPSDTGKPSDAGKPSATISAQATPGTTMALVQQIEQDAKTSSLPRLAVNCGATLRPAPAGTSNGSGPQDGATPSAKPTDVPGGKPTGTPGHS